MKWWPRRRPAPQPTPPRANSTRIAVLEHDLLGVKPKPGTAAAAVIALRRAGTCIQHDPCDISTIGDGPGTRVICNRCGQRLCDADGEWVIAQA